MSVVVVAVVVIFTVVVIVAVVTVYIITVRSSVCGHECFIASFQMISGRGRGASPSLLLRILGETNDRENHVAVKCFDVQVLPCYDSSFVLVTDVTQKNSWNRMKKPREYGW